MLLSFDSIVIESEQKIEFKGKQEMISCPIVRVVTVVWSADSTRVPSQALVAIFEDPRNEAEN